MLAVFGFAGWRRRSLALIATPALILLTAEVAWSFQFGLTEWHALTRMAARDNIHAVARHNYWLNPVVLALLIPVSLGLPATLLLLLGIGRRRASDDPPAPDRAILLLPAAAFAVNYCLLAIPFPRHLLPVIPALAVAAGGGLWFFGRRLAPWAAGAALLYQAIYVFSVERQFVWDTRAEMREWIRMNLPSDAPVHVSNYNARHTWRDVCRPRVVAADAPYLLLHEMDLRRYQCSVINPFRAWADSARTYRPSGWAKFYVGVLRGQQPYREIARARRRPLTPELWLHERYWGAFPEFVGDTILYARAPVGD